jgi:D-erythronate 2-dehydrogenase
MKILITGGTGFLGRHILDRLLQVGAMGVDGARIDQLTLIARRPDGLPEDSRLRVVHGDFRDKAVRARALEGGVDIVLHLASAMAGAAELQRDTAFDLNIASSLEFLNELRDLGTCPRVVYASSIGVYGSAVLDDHVDDDTRPRPNISYGTDKLINELYIADLSRRGEIDGISLRLPACLPRPRQPDDTPSPDMASSIFHALKAGDDFRMPVEPDAQMWFLSVPCFVDNFLFAATLPAAALDARRVLQMPAQHFTLGVLAKAIQDDLGAKSGKVSWHPQPGLKQRLADFPPLRTPAADALGLHHDGDLATLVRRTLDSIAD